ncbi:hypothetical protein NSERUTF1_5744 [Nocardia seriolae]|nr:hypothetical protein NSERUTF1_5744 [Nocardia seriolae]
MEIPSGSHHLTTGRLQHSFDRFRCYTPVSEVYRQALVWVIAGTR